VHEARRKLLISEECPADLQAHGAPGKEDLEREETRSKDWVKKCATSLMYDPKESMRDTN
jgi:hypothetical protein